MQMQLSFLLLLTIVAMSTVDLVQADDKKYFEEQWKKCVSLAPNTFSAFDKFAVDCVVSVQQKTTEGPLRKSAEPIIKARVQFVEDLKKDFPHLKPFVWICLQHDLELIVSSIASTDPFNEQDVVDLLDGSNCSLEVGQSNQLAAIIKKRLPMLVKKIGATLGNIFKEFIKVKNGG